MPTPITRRGFLSATSAVVGATATFAGEQQVKNPEPAAPKVPVIDTHLHCFAGGKDERFPYHPLAPYRPTQAATPEDLLHCMNGAGVDFAVVVHPEPYQDDHRYLEHCLAIGKGRLKGTCLFFADRPGSVEKMPELVKRLGLVAARIHAYAPGRLPPFRQPELRGLWKSIADLGIAVQLHFEPRYAPGFEPFIEEFASTPVIIDHLGRPFQGTPQEHAVVVRWSRFKNTIMKLSAIPEREEYPHRDIRPVIKQLTDAFGADRLLWGGGFNASATPESYRAARELARSHIAHLSAEDQTKVLGGTAARLFKFGT